MYRFIKKLLFLMDAETAHHWTMMLLRLSKGFGFKYQSRKNHSFVMNLKFTNRLGLAAGLDKNGIAMDAWKNLGFGFVEIGTVTPRPQYGNSKPRLFRLIQDLALINRMGFNNEGMEVIYQRLKKEKPKNLIVGVNIGKNKDTPIEKAIEDYVLCFDQFYNLADYIVVNVSSPNTPNLRELQDREHLYHLMQALNQRSLELKSTTPKLLKIAPDLNTDQLNAIVDLIELFNWEGVVACNTTVQRTGLKSAADVINRIGNGGLSGAPITSLSNERISYLRSKLSKHRIIIGVGGIMSAEDAVEKFKAGADLIQLYTGFIYQGPQLIKTILSDSRL